MPTPPFPSPDWPAATAEATAILSRYLQFDTTNPPSHTAEAARFLDDLLTRAITTSDNTANDRLARAVGGYSAVRAMIARKGLGAIRFANGERAM